MFSALIYASCSYAESVLMGMALVISLRMVICLIGVVSVSS